MVLKHETLASNVVFLKLGWINVDTDKNSGKVWHRSKIWANCFFATCWPQAPTVKAWIVLQKGQTCEIFGAPGTFPKKTLGNFGLAFFLGKIPKGWQTKMTTLQGTNISILGKRKIIFKMFFSGDMLVSGSAGPNLTNFFKWVATNNRMMKVHPTKNTSHPKNPDPYENARPY